jgi:hypothetical protein
MPRILINGEWYDPIAPNSVFEPEYEELVLQHSAALFPDFECVPYTRLVNSPVGDSKADLALVDRDYRSWYVLEIELASHSLSGHVLPQMQRLSLARYGADDAAWIASRNSHLDANRMRYLMDSVSPGFMVIVNAPVPGWIEPLRWLGVSVAIVEPFRNRLDKHVLRVNGEQPDVAGETLTTLARGVDWFSRHHRIENPGAVVVPDSGELELLWAGTSFTARTKWIAGSLHAALDPAGTIPDALVLKRRSDGRLEIEELRR